MTRRGPGAGTVGAGTRAPLPSSGTVKSSSTCASTTRLEAEEVVALVLALLGEPEDVGEDRHEEAVRERERRVCEGLVSDPLVAVGEKARPVGVARRARAGLERDLVREDACCEASSASCSRGGTANRTHRRRQCS